MYNSFRNKLLAIALMPLTAGFLQAQEEKSADADTPAQPVVQLESISVVGSKENVGLLPGSAAYIDESDIRNQNYEDIHRIVRRVPGVYFREEDGFGVFANLSLRGANSNRSSKVTMMEDGVLTSPAPYSSPAAYYTPTAGRMHGIEILKGSSQIMYGPETTGGVINYLSTPIPADRNGYVKATYGTDNDIRLHMNYGDVVETPYGNFGFVIENYHRRSDGFKEIDQRPGMNNTKPRLTKNEPMIKFAWEPNTSVPQRLEFKVAYTDLEFNETYLGLTEEDIKTTPYRRYAASRFDNIDADQTRTYLRHVIEPNPDLRLTTTGYYNQFNRNWFKLNKASLDPTGAGGWRSPPQVLAGAYGPGALDVIRGDAAGSLEARANNREYQSFGIENLTQFTFDSGSVEHAFDVGIRLHQDEERRFQNNATYEQNNNGAIVGETIGAPGSQDNRMHTSRAIAVFAQDRIGFGQWAVTPGVRFEHVRYKVEDYRSFPSTSKSSDINVFAPGIGLTFDHTDNLTYFAGLYRGISLPGPSARVNNGIKEETTLSFETGARFNNRKGFRSELVFFYTDFDNLVVPESIGSGTSVTENVGEAVSYGIEALIGYDPGIANDWGFNNPNTLAFTWTDATLSNDTTSTDAGSIFSGGLKGNRLPYIPRYMVNIGTGLEFSRWAFYADANYIPSTYATANNSSSHINPGTGLPDSRFGKIDSRLIVDISVNYRLTDDAKLIAGIHNLFDKEYISSRLPHGPRPGQPLMAHVGLEVTF